MAWPARASTPPRAQPRACIDETPSKAEVALDKIMKAVEVVTYAQCGDVRIVGAAGEACLPSFAGIFRYYGNARWELLGIRIQGQTTLNSLTFEQLACLGFALETSCGERARFRRTQGSCRAALDVTFKDAEWVSPYELHLVDHPPPLACD